MTDNEERETTGQTDMFASSEPEQSSAEDGPENESFESLLGRLEEIVGKMEGGGLSLEASMELYEEGVKKAGRLTAMLADAREKVMKLVTGPDGDTALEEFGEGEQS